MERRCDNCEWCFTLYTIYPSSTNNESTIIDENDGIFAYSEEERDLILKDQKGSTYSVHRECREDSPKIYAVRNQDGYKKISGWPEVQPDAWCRKFSEKVKQENLPYG
jgi:hypothetical protein